MKRSSVIFIFFFALFAMDTVDAADINPDELGPVLWLENDEELNPLGNFYVDEDDNEFFFAPDELILGEDGLLHLPLTFRGERRNCNAVSGEASWYGPGFNGHKTANGETYNMNAMTAAHKSLKFGTILKVTFKGRSVNVRINDAGPYHGARVIDLSKAAATAIGLIGPGHGQVQLSVVKCGI